MNKSRLVAYTDAIIAIIVTILVLSLPYLDHFTYHSLITHWPAYFIYIITFLQLMGVWLNHHNLFAKIKEVDKPIFWTNAVWLLIISFLPYAVKWVGEFPDKWQPETFYLFIIVLGSAAFSLLRMAAARSNHLKVRLPYWIYFVWLIVSVITYFWPYFGLITAFGFIVYLITNPLENEPLD